MATLPPDGPPDNVIPLPGANDPELLALKEIFPAWWISRREFGAVQAEFKSPTAVLIRIVAADNIADLHQRLQVIEDAAADSQEPA